MANAQQKLSSSLKACKLQDTVKLMSINMSKVYGKSQTRRNESAIPREIKKWMKMDVGLFEYDLPVIKYYPRNANMSSSSVTVQLNDIIHVEHIIKFSKPNVLLIEFPLYSLLLSFKSKERMDLWMSELLCLTNIYTLLLYDTSNAKFKSGYYQLRFMLDKVTVYDAITKKKSWTWEVSHIRGYSRTKSSGVKIEVGKESSVNGFFCFTGKQVKSFCEQLQKLGHKIAQRKTKHAATLPVPLSKQPAQSVEHLLLPPTSPRRCSNDYVTTIPYSLHSSVPMNLHKAHSNNQLHDTSGMNSKNQIASISDTASISSFEIHSAAIAHSTSLDGFQDNCQTKQQPKVLKKCVSLNDLIEEDDYVVPAIVPLSISHCMCNEYLTILPNQIDCYEVVTDTDGHYERLDSMAYSSGITALKNMYS